MDSWRSTRWAAPVTASGYVSLTDTHAYTVVRGLLNRRVMLHQASSRLRIARLAATWGAAAGLAIVALNCVDTSGEGGTTTGVVATSAASTTGGEGAAGGGTQTGKGSGPAGSGGGEMAQGGAGGAANCQDEGPGEPNESDAAATKVADTEDCDDVKNVVGTVAGAADADWYRFVQPKDNIGCVLDPTMAWSQPMDAQLRVCMYVKCAGGDAPDVDCDNGSEPDTTMGGFAGCCGIADYDLGLVNCDGLTDVVEVFIRVDNPNGDAASCVDYNLSYRL